MSPTRDPTKQVFLLYNWRHILKIKLVFLNMPTLYVHSTEICIWYHTIWTSLGQPDSQGPGSRAASEGPYSHSY